MGSSKGPVRKGVWVRIPPRALTVRRPRDNSNVRSMEQVHQVAALVATGMNDCEIARRTEIPRRTVMEWRHARRWEGWPRSAFGAGCLRCGGHDHAFDALPPAYAYLLGAYLGDGCLARSRRGVYRLRITLDDRYPAIIAECQAAAQAVLPENRVGVQRRHGQGCSEVYVYSKALVCLFPQHGPGPKHKRPIELTDWQREIVGREPEPFLRGLIHSDGCRSTNTVRHASKAYAYPRYTFSNASADIRRLFTDACDLLGIEWRVMNARNISVARRASVAPPRRVRRAEDVS